ncbi:alpha/beta hydrolase [Arcanobacterium phocae]|uniref:Alpha/beta hydrolase family protein n=1 Tax=Arcanobacterium phocae TaxID=131112 RepID=A0A1H2LHI5_9ACTO|nr:alpha/beta hydrolase [Arcanobacterium phocae]SDU80497.1 Alpha/beta hydrolase family protein [Arcanobacterium phocae]
MNIIVPGLALAPEFYEARFPIARVVDTWCFPWISSCSDANNFYYDGEPITLIGHSLGGLMALEWALLFPQNVCRLVLLDPTFPRDNAEYTINNPLANIATRLLPLSLAPFFDNSILNRRYRGKQNRQFLAHQWNYASTLETRVSQLLTASTVAPHIRTHVIVGAGNGRQTRFLMEQRTLASMLDAKLVMLWGENHLFPLTNPELVLPFISQV